MQKGGTLVDYDEFTEDEKAKMTLDFLELPVNAVFYLNGFKGSYFLGTGITPAIALSGKVKEQYAGEEESVDLKFGVKDEDDLKSFDFGINFLAGYEFKSKYMVAVSYNLGFANLSNVPGKFNTGYIGVKFGYMLKAR